ncbi:hypothetical protein, partial [Zavarzinia aquatilis]
HPSEAGAALPRLQLQKGTAMITEDIQALVAAVSPGHPACWHTGMDRQAVAILRERLEVLARDVAALEAQLVPDHLRGSMPRDLAALDGKVITMAEVTARARARRKSVIVHLVPAEGGEGGAA